MTALNYSEDGVEDEHDDRMLKCLPLKSVDHFAVAGLNKSTRESYSFSSVCPH